MNTDITLLNELLNPNLHALNTFFAGSSGRAFYGAGLRPLVCWDCGFESHRVHGYLLCVVLSGRGLCNEMIARREKSYQLWCDVVCDLETSWMRRSWSTGGCCANNKYILHAFPVPQYVSAYHTCHHQAVFIAVIITPSRGPLYMMVHAVLCRNMSLNW
jgi:hypothetical protein